MNVFEGDEDENIDGEEDKNSPWAVRMCLNLKIDWIRRIV